MYCNVIYTNLISDHSENIAGGGGVDAFEEGAPRFHHSLEGGSACILPILRGGGGGGRQRDSANPWRGGTQILPKTNYQKTFNSSNKAIEQHI